MSDSRTPTASSRTQNSVCAAGLPQFRSLPSSFGAVSVPVSPSAPNVPRSFLPTPGLSRYPTLNLRNYPARRELPIRPTSGPPRRYQCSSSPPSPPPSSSLYRLHLPWRARLTCRAIRPPVRMATSSCSVGAVIFGSAHRPAAARCALPATRPTKVAPRLVRTEHPLSLTATATVDAISSS